MSKQFYELLYIKYYYSKTQEDHEDKKIRKEFVESHLTLPSYCDKVKSPPFSFFVSSKFAR